MAAALLVIDVQRELVDGLPPPRRAAFVEIVRSLLHSARAAGVPVVYVRHDGGPGGLMPDTPGWQIAAEVAPAGGERIVDKRFRDAFRETNLAALVPSSNALNPPLRASMRKSPRRFVPATWKMAMSLPLGKARLPMASTDRPAVLRGDVWVVSLDPVVGAEAV